MGSQGRGSGWALLVAAALVAGAPAAAPAAELTLRVCGFENRDGNLRVAVFAREHAGHFQSPDPPAFAVGVTLRLTDAAPADAATVRVPLPPLAAGDYAVRALHDQNANGQMDREGLLGRPAEPYGYSRNASARFGPPSFDEAAFTLGDEPLSLDIRLTRWSLTGDEPAPCPP